MYPGVFHGEFGGGGICHMVVIDSAPFLHALFVTLRITQCDIAHYMYYSSQVYYIHYSICVYVNKVI